MAEPGAKLMKDSPIDDVHPMQTHGAALARTAFQAAFHQGLPCIGVRTNASK
jgi:hypothetical protein